MNTSSEQREIANVKVDVVRKDIKNMHLAVYPPTGRIRLSAPEKTDPEVVRLFAISKLSWIKKHVKNFKNQARETQRKYIDGESHYFFGNRYLLKIKEHDGYAEVRINGAKKIELKIFLIFF